MKPKICVSIPAFTDTQTMSQIQKLDAPDLIEIRFDFRVEDIDVKKIREATNIPLIGTNRRQDQGGFANEIEEKRVSLLEKASKAGYQYIDIAITTPNIDKIIESFKKKGSKVIVSYHDFQKTPTRDTIQEVYLEAKEKGATLVKIIGTAIEPKDNMVYLNFLNENPGNISFGMSQHGVTSRVMSPLLGGEFTYASAEEGKESASGQLTLNQMKQLYRLLGV